MRLCCGRVAAMTSLGARLGWLVLGVAVVTSGCKLKLNRSRESIEATSAPAVAMPPAPTAASRRTAPIAATASPVPTASSRHATPSFAVLPGEGLGPIRFGSTVATVERHMQAKCEQLTDKYCRYIGSGLELELTNGVVTGIVIHRYQRPVAGEPGKTWGLFNGGIPPKVFMMMVPEAVIEEIGKPQRSEVVAEENPNWTVQRDYYPGMVLEYDRNRVNDRLMLGQIRIVKR